MTHISSPCSNKGSITSKQENNRHAALLAAAQYGQRQLSKTNKGVDDENHNPVKLSDDVPCPSEGELWLFNLSSLSFNVQAESKPVLP